MTTHVLTPNTANPLTGFANPILGWQFSAATALDAFEGCNLIFAAGWASQMGPLPTSSATAPIWQLVITTTATTAAGATVQVPVVANDTDYFVFDGKNVWTIPLATVQAEYTVTTQSS